MNLSAPTMPVFAVAVILAVLSALAHYAGISIPVIGRYAYDVLALGFVVLVAGNLLKGI